MPPQTAALVANDARPMVASARARLAQSRGRTQTSPRKGMTLAKMFFIIPIAAIFDALRFIFVMIVFTLPFIIGGLATAYAANSHWLSWAPSWVIGLAVSIGIGTAEILNPEVIPALAAFGVLMASIIGFIGFGFLLAILTAMRVKITPHNSLWLALAFVGGVTPFGNALPSLTPITVKILYRQMKDDKKAHALYLAQQAERRAAAQQAQLSAAQEQQEMLALEAARQEQAEREAAEAEEAAAAENEEPEEQEEELVVAAPKRRAPLIGPPSLIPEEALEGV